MLNVHLKYLETRCDKIYLLKCTSTTDDQRYFQLLTIVGFRKQCYMGKGSVSAHGERSKQETKHGQLAQS